MGVSIRYEYLGVELPAIDFVETNMVEWAHRCLVRSDTCAFKKVLNKAGKKWERLEFGRQPSMSPSALMRLCGCMGGPRNGRLLASLGGLAIWSWTGTWDISPLIWRGIARSGS